MPPYVSWDVYPVSVPFFLKLHEHLCTCQSCVFWNSCLPTNQLITRAAFISRTSLLYFVAQSPFEFECVNLQENASLSTTSRVSAKPSPPRNLNYYVVISPYMDHQPRHMRYPTVSVFLIPSTLCYQFCIDRQVSTVLYSIRSTLLCSTLAQVN